LRRFQRFRAGLFGTGMALFSARARDSAPSRTRRARPRQRGSAYLTGNGKARPPTNAGPLASFLSTCAVNTCVPKGRSLGAIVTGTSKQRRGNSAAHRASSPCGLTKRCDSGRYAWAAPRLPESGLEDGCPCRRRGRGLIFFHVPEWLHGYPLPPLTFPPGFSLDFSFELKRVQAFRGLSPGVIRRPLRS